MQNDVRNRMLRMKPAFMRKPVYESYQKNLEFSKDLFLKSINPERFEELPIINIEPIRKPVTKEIYEGLTICDLDVAEVGCGPICALQAATNVQEYCRWDMMEICETIETKGYYYPGRGLWWHFFDAIGCRRLHHWYQIITSLDEGNVVTVLVNLPDRSRGLFVNILGVRNTNDGDYIEKTEDLVFLTSEGELTLETLRNYISTAPYAW